MVNKLANEVQQTMSFALFTDSTANLTEAEYTASRVEVAFA